MSTWKKYKLGDLITESKILSINSNPDKRITVKLNLKGVEKRPISNDVEGATKYYIRKKGQFIYGKQNLHKGAFGIIPSELDGYESSADIPAFDVNPKCRPEWILYNLKKDDYYLTLEQFAIGRGSRRIHPHQIEHLEIPVPPIAEQDKLLLKLYDVEILNAELKNEQNNQIKLISYFRQAIITDAILGKIVPSDSKDEDANVLLKKIKAENKLEPVLEKEVPYQIPPSWKWVRLGEICDKIGSGSTPRGGKEVYKSSGIKFIRSQNVYNEGLVFENVAYIDNSIHIKMAGTKVIPNDILLNITGGSIGRCALVSSDFDEANVSQHVTIIRLKQGLINRFIHLVILSSYFQNKIMAVQTGGNREGLAKKNMQMMLIPLPPIVEQQRIIKRVNQLMEFCDELESQVKNSQKNSEWLVGAVLKEAFNEGFVA